MTADNLSALTSPQHVVEKCHFRGQKNRTRRYPMRDKRMGILQPACLLAMSTYPATIPIYITN